MEELEIQQLWYDAIEDFMIAFQEERPYEQLKSLYRRITNLYEIVNSLKPDLSKFN